ncbi:hypothetical protein M409DRAFT_54528 [Zasmidium cellare ATCC 36951]|uniref:Uncharacterized protein n=1 Tax=Zasmidium cellare ATCC 36951 TaxID=1080233 RepID=A0A6A6CHK9_ZASCE|nr:uncharacterized protein M409DRAFT_54528 [Zasmidium cellare ATCC 36951]KAF2166737.1 hypothetical protein M409DRAFT_54528 [Zasmidium cellare ATCC 36951]
MDPSAPAFNISPRRTINKPDWIITSDEVEQGCILWLGTPTETMESQRRRGAPTTQVINAQSKLPANNGMYEHPFLVLSRPASDPSRIYFLPMTSLGGQSLASKYTLRKAAYHQATFLPVAPAELHPLYLAGDNRYRTLTLKNGDRLEKSTYVNVRELYEMDWRDAQLYWGSNPTLRKKWKLDMPSIQTVLNVATNNLKIAVERQYFPALENVTFSPTNRLGHGYRSQLLSPLHRRLSNHSNMMHRSRTIPAMASPIYRPITPPQPFVQRSPTSPPRYAVRSQPPTIHPALQAEFSPPGNVQSERAEGSQQAQRAVEEETPLLLSYNLQTPGDVEQPEQQGGESVCGGWWMLWCPCQ